MRHRSGLTIVEMLVSMALVMFIMVILAEAFATGMQTFRTLKSIGDMSNALRSISVVIRNDLSAIRFKETTLPATSYPAGSIPNSLRLSELTYPVDASNNPIWVPPEEGFLQVWQGSPAGSASYVLEGNDPADPSITSYRATDHRLHFSVDLERRAMAAPYNAGSPGFTPENFYQAFATWIPATSAFFANQEVPAYAYGQSNLFNSRQAEVTYFLKPTGESANGTPLQNLYRRMRLAVPNQPITLDPLGLGNALDANSPGAYRVTGTEPADSEISCRNDPDLTDPLSAGKLYFNTLADLTIPERRFAGNRTAATAGIPHVDSTDTPLTPSDTYPNLATGDDILLPNVVSFQVQIMYRYKDAVTGNLVLTEFVDVPAGNNSRYNDLTLFTAPARVFDTWSQKGPQLLNSLPLNSYDYSAWATAGTPTSLPLRINVVGLRITIRVWDPKTESVRQITIEQDM